nr:uncharacterized protein CI109_001719 [Kwoniella shandongensis]KAA5529780.1 hypothetical protein CI109_001719 [Kwoniella shandongensis]
MNMKLTFLASSLALASFASAASYIGCTSTYNVNFNDETSYKGTAGIQTADCPAYCVDFAYSYSNEGQSGTCICSNLSPVENTYLDAVDSTGTCPNNPSLPNGSTFTVNKINTDFTFAGCSINAVPTNPVISVSPDINTCFVTCAPYPFFTANPRPATNDFECVCTTAYDSTGTNDNCGPDTLFGFQHVPQASGIAKRRLRARLNLAKEEEAKLLCPRGTTACVVPSSEDAYECVDTRSELESCGGCLYGTFGDNANNATVGVDCSTLPGAAMGASTCLLGSCNVFACQAGHNLVDRACVKA